MSQLYETDKDMEEVILISIDNGKNDVELNLRELAELVKTSGAQVLGEATQKRDKPHPSTYFGKGKIEELKSYISLVNATGIVCDDELNSNQLKNLSDTLDVKVMDRTMVILDIFAKRALSAEGKAQVELAQLKYNSSRLVGLGKSLSRQGGGIGSRGPGEKKLETDRRHIHDRISELEHELEEIKVQRKVQRERRSKNRIPVISLVGYTNAGKSTLMNKLTNANILAEDKLFATLDTTTRKLTINTREVVFTDTVGFIQKLPHTLIKAFNSTLEELKYADVLVHVVDVSSDYFQQQMTTVYETLEELDCNDKAILTVFNKIDLLEDDKLITLDPRATDIISISAFEGKNLDLLLEKIDNILNLNSKEVEIIVPFSEGNLIEELHRTCQIIERTYLENGVHLKINANDEINNKIKNFIVE